MKSGLYEPPTEGSPRGSMLFLYVVYIYGPTWYYDRNFLSRGYTQICSLVRVFLLFNLAPSFSEKNPSLLRMV